MRIDACRVSRKILDRIESGFPPGSVSAIFERSIHIEAGDGFLIHIASAGTPLTPRSIAVPARCFSTHVRPHARVGERVVGGQGCIWWPDSGVCLSTRDSRVFEAGLDWPADSLPHDVVHRNLIRVMRALESGRTKGTPRSPLGGYFLARASGVQRPGTVEEQARPADKEEKGISLLVKRSLWAKADSLLEAMTGKKGTPLREIAVGMIGLGPGLTPSGDDFLAAFTSVGVAMGRGGGEMGPRARALARILLEEAGGRTAPLSAAMFEDASRGEMNEPVLRFISSILRDQDLAHAEPYAREVASIGAFSGEDLLNGAAAALAVFPWPAGVHVEEGSRPPWPMFWRNQQATANPVRPA